MSQRFIKDPDAKLDYTIDWSSWLTDSETISSVVWTVGTGITEESTSNTTTTATIWLSGGTAGERYAAACRITTSDSRIDERTIFIMVAER